MNLRPQVIIAGSYVNDYCFTTKVIPKEGETRIGTFNSSPGGKGFNQSVACSRVGIPSLFIGAIGDDVAAVELKKFLKHEELKCKFYVDKSEHTGVAGIIVDQFGKNQIVVSMGANLNLPVAHLMQNVEYFDTAEVFLCQLEANYDAMEFGLKLAKKKSLVSILNPAPINEVIDINILQYVDILTPNELEFVFLLGHFFSLEITEKIEHIPDGVLDNYCRKLGDITVVLTLGEHGCFVSRASKVGGGFYRIPAISINPIDTTGAGDSFNGGLAAGLVMSKFNLLESIKIANTMGGLATLNIGTAPAMPKKDVVGAFLSSNNQEKTFEIFNGYSE